MRDEQKGFSAIEAFLIVAVIAIVGFVGWQVYISNMSTASVTNNSGTTDVPQPPRHKRVIALGDMVCDPKDGHRISGDRNYCQDGEIVRLVKQLVPDAIFVLGDLQYDDGSLEKFQDTFSKNWGNLKNIMYPAPGNHEYITPQANGYYTYFKDSPVDVSKGYYSFMLGSWHILSLNSNCDKTDDCGPESQQIQWLDKDLSKNHTKCTLAFWHHPHFTSGKYVNDSDTKARSANMWEKLSAHRADLVLNGHDHLFERFSKQDASGQPSAQGMRQFTVGTGGKSHYDHTGSALNSEKIIGDQYGVLMLDLYKDLYKWQFKNTGGQTLDSGSQRCNY